MKSMQNMTYDDGLGQKHFIGSWNANAANSNDHDNHDYNGNFDWICNSGYDDIIYVLILLEITKMKCYD